MIWELVAPAKEKKIVSVATRRIETETYKPDHLCKKQKKHGECDHQPKKIVGHRLTFRPRQQKARADLVLLHICQESRAYLLSRGGMITFPYQFDCEQPFTKGLWWNHDDIFVFGCDWHRERLHDEMLGDFDGLEHVRHVAISNEHARSLGYSQVFLGRHIKDIFASLEPDADPSARPLPQAIRLQFEGYKDNGVAKLHFIPRYFPGLHSITVAFPELCFDTTSLTANAVGNPNLQPCPNHPRRPRRGPGRMTSGSWESRVDSKYMHEQVALGCKNATVTFQVKKPGNMKTALRKVKKLRDLWASLKVRGHGRGLGFDVDRDYVRGPVLAAKAGHQVQDKYLGGEFRECRALPINVMGLRKPRFKGRRELL